jgi:hypothetical protein
MEARARLWVRVALVAGLLVIAGCGRSPSTPDPSTPAAIGPNARCAQFVPSVDDDESDAKVPVLCEHRGVTYVPMAAWTPSERVKRLEATERHGPTGFMTFPPLTSHRAIGETRGFSRRRRRR